MLTVYFLTVLLEYISYERTIREYFVFSATYLAKCIIMSQFMGILCSKYSHAHSQEVTNLIDTQKGQVGL